MQLDKEDTRQSNQKSKCVFNILILLYTTYMYIVLTESEVITGKSQTEGLMY